MIKQIFYLALMGWGLAMNAPTLALTLTLKPTVTLQYLNVTLEKVADIDNLPPTLAQDLRQLKLANAPKPGQSIVLSRQAIAQRIRYTHPALLPLVQWQGADSVTIIGDAQPIDPAHLQAVAAQALQAALAHNSISLELQLSEPIGALVLPEGEVKIVARRIAADSLRKRMSVWLDINVGTHYRRALPVWFSVTAHADVLVATTDIAIGDRLDPRQFETKRLDIANLRRAPLLHSLPHDQVRAKRNIPSGAILAQDDIGALPPISRFQEVAVHVISKGIVLETSGTAVTDGALGQSVRIKNSRSGKEFLATVVAPGLANIVTR